ncbi:phage minor head protein [Devosia sp. J2-20]|uniref:phage head morphogenesis protein n=1 Tax=Devosia sp. J2-20 TaxID=3026161 RepID=UPI00249AECF2|nr:phage minor head protein [Devosia sp. J2-20]WDR00740.1 phage minor head protein [Devosia sp. J2-20]
MAIDLKPVAPKAAIDALITRGMQLYPSFAWQEVYAEIHGTMFTVAKSAGFDILEEIFNGLLVALEDGQTYQDFARDLIPLLQVKGWWGRQAVTNPGTGLPEIAQLGSTRRLQLIFDVNMRVSYAAGHWASFQRNKAARPFLRYVHLVGQEHPRLHHQAWHNVCLLVDHPWWNTHFAPNGWNCHCTIQSLSQRDVDRLIADGEVLRFEAPAEQLREWTNKVTGEVRKIDTGIDPGWDHNPGKSGWGPTVERLGTKPDPLNIR